MELGRIQPASNGGNIGQFAGIIRERLGSVLKLIDQLEGNKVPSPVRDGQPITEKAIRSLIRHRRNRDRFFGADLFADPAWDMLLELYAAELGQQRLSVSSLCMGAAVPQTTALRWINQLERKGLIQKSLDLLDGRRYFVSLSGQGLSAIERYFQTVPIGEVLI